MGSLYYEHKKCGMSVAIFGQCVGFVRCERCGEDVTHDENPMFPKHKFECGGCGATVSFDAAGGAQYSHGKRGGKLHITAHGTIRCDCLACGVQMTPVKAKPKRGRSTRAAPVPVTA